MNTTRIIPIYQIDTFTDEVFAGNPAAVCPLEDWLPDALLQQIAAENNLSETAFYVPQGSSFTIRWFTPSTEVDLCGHATLASAFVINLLGLAPEGSRINFYSPRSGNLYVQVQDGLFTLDFPKDELREVPLTEDMARSTDKTPLRAFRGKADLMLTFADEDAIRNMQPNLDSIRRLGTRGLIVTAPGAAHDFVSRFFGPAVGVDEDPVCGSAHTSLIPFWASVLAKADLSAAQLSKRGGQLQAAMREDRVLIAGRAALYLKGEIFL